MQISATFISDSTACGPLAFLEGFLCPPGM